MNKEVKNIWNINAESWDSRMGEGNDFHKILIEPTQLKLLNIQPGQKILDVACGKGGDVVFFVMDYHTNDVSPEKTRCYLGKHVDTISECFDDCLKTLDGYYRAFCRKKALEQLEKIND